MVYFVFWDSNMKFSERRLSRWAESQYSQEDTRLSKYQSLTFTGCEFRVRVVKHGISWRIRLFNSATGCGNFVSCAGFVSKLLCVRTSRRGDYTKRWVLEKPPIKYTELDAIHLSRMSGSWDRVRRNLMLNNRS